MTAHLIIGMLSAVRERSRNPSQFAADPRCKYSYPAEEFLSFTKEIFCE